MTYNVLKRSDFKAAAPLKSDFQPEEYELIESQRSRQRKKQRKIKRGLVVVAGWTLMAAMTYLILYMPTRVAQIWNPYDILGISEVGSCSPFGVILLTCGSLRQRNRSIRDIRS